MTNFQKFTDGLAALAKQCGVELMMAPEPSPVVPDLLNADEAKRGRKATRFVVAIASRSRR